MNLNAIVRLFSDFGGALLGVSILTAGILFIGHVDSKTNDNSERLDRQKDHMIRVEGEFKGSIIMIQTTLNEILQRTSRIEQFQQDHK